MSPTIYTFGKPREDQRIFVGVDDKVYLFDWSGSSPLSTDDGPLRVDDGAEAMAILDTKGQPLFRIQVEVERTESKGYVWAGTDCVEKLVTLRRLNFKFDPTFLRLAQNIDQVRLLAAR